MVIKVLTALEEVLEEKHIAVLYELRNIFELVLEYQAVFCFLEWIIFPPNHLVSILMLQEV